MATSRKPRPLKERFDAAVNVIRSLPTEGPYQPSNTTKLRFYALYKQVTQGPCNNPKPNFWDTVGRAKWEAWNMCGEMSNEVAMQMYVEELQRLVETMPQTTEVEQFLHAIGPFYEEMDSKETNDKPTIIETPSVGTETTPVAMEMLEEVVNEDTRDGDLSPESTNESKPPTKLANQIADVSDGESDGEDFKDSFQELSPDPHTRPTTSSPGHTSSTHIPTIPPASRGNRPPRTVTFADPPIITRESPHLRNVPALSTGNERILLRSPEGYPLAMETVTAEVSRLQTNIQSMLQQLNSLALAVSGLTRMVSIPSGERSTASAAAVGSHNSQVMVPRLVTRRGRLLTLLLRIGPVLALWPIVVTIVMGFISKRTSLLSRGLPSWVWLVVSSLQALFTLLIVRQLQLNSILRIAEHLAIVHRKATISIACRH